MIPNINPYSAHPEDKLDNLRVLLSQQRKSSTILIQNSIEVKKLYKELIQDPRNHILELCEELGTGIFILNKRNQKIITYHPNPTSVEKHGKNCWDLWTGEDHPSSLDQSREKAIAYITRGNKE